MSCLFFSSRRRHTRWPRDWSSDVCSSDLPSIDGGDDFQQSQATLDRGTLFKNSLFELQLERFRIDAFIIFRHLQHAAERVVEIGRASCRERGGYSVVIVLGLVIEVCAVTD